MLSHHKIGSFGRETSSSNKSDSIQVSSAAASTKASYSYSVEDLATVCCFFDDQETKEDSRK